MSIARWIDEKVIALSHEEIIKNYRVYNARRQVKHTRVKLSIGEPSALVVSIEQDDGRWIDRAQRQKLNWRTGRGQSPYLACVARTRLKYKGWTSSPVEMVGFLRIGTAGVYFMTANGDRITVAAPPFDKEPPAMVQTLTPGADGFLAHSAVAHPDRPAWDVWASEIACLTQSIRARVDDRGRIADLDQHARNPNAACSQCGRHPATDVGTPVEWRLARLKLYCATCSQREL